MADTTNTKIEKAYGIGNIKNAVPIVLDLERLNYEAWRELFYTHCVGYGEASHLDSTKDKPDDADWLRMNSMVKSWIYATLSQPLLNTVLKSSSTAGKLWTTLESLFRDNRDAKIIQLDNELRNIVMGDSNITQYYARIQTICDVLENIGSTVPEKNIVTYLINGLSQKFAPVAIMLRHKSPFPNFMETRSILLLEEQQMEHASRRYVNESHGDNSSSPTVLNANHSNNSNNNRGGRNGGRGGRGGGRNSRGGRSGGRDGGRQGPNGGRQNQSTGAGAWVWCPWPSAQQQGLLPSPFPPTTPAPASPQQPFGIQ